MSRSSWLILGSVILFVIAVYFASKLRVFYDLEAFFPQNDPELEYFEEHRDRFQADDNFIYIAVENSPSIFDSVFLKKMDSLTKSLKQVPYQTNVSSLTNLQNFMYSGVVGMIPIAALHWKEPARYAKDSLRILQDERLLHRYISEDGQTMAVIFTHQARLPQKELDTMMVHIHGIMDAFEPEFEKMHLSGRAETTVTIINAVESEFLQYAGISALLVILIMSLLLRRFWGVALALASVLMGLAFILGFLGAIGQPLDIMAPLFPTLMLVVGMSDVVHILSKYLDEIGKGCSKEKALRIAIKEIGWATLLTSVTTAIGFASLATSNLQAIKDFGIYAALGVLLVYVAVIMFTTSVMYKLRPDQLADVQQHNQFWDKLMERCYVIVRDYPKQIFAISGLVFALSLWGLSLVSTNVYMLSDMPTADKIRADFIFFEEKLSGIRVFEAAIEAQNDYEVEDLAVLEEVEKLTNYLKTVEAIGTVYSPNTIYKSMHQANNANKTAFYDLPKSDKQIQQYKHQIAKNGNSKQLGLLISEDGKYARVNGTMRDLGSEKVGEINNEIRAWVGQNINPDIAKIKLTGTAIIVDKNHEYLRKNLLTGLALAFIVVSVIMAILFRDVKMALLALIPNTFPLLITGAVMGFTGIGLKATTSIIFTIAFGIAVDDTIHFLSKYKLQLNKGKTVDEAIRTTFLETGKALCITTIILFFGFMVLVFSDFLTTYYIGLLVSITLFTALIADLFLLPVCLKWISKE